MKRRAIRIFSWLHSGKITLISNLWLYFGMIFLVCHLYLKADGVDSYPIPAKWCLREYMNFIETLATIAIDFLDSYCNLKFRYYVPPYI